MQKTYYAVMLAADYLEDNIRRVIADMRQCWKKSSKLIVQIDYIRASVAVCSHIKCSGVPSPYPADETSRRQPI
ncbi:hypothetical protein TNCV_4741351 [Trichonephila clavipes]|nr:hypothetical protein TNCV_4741351 [Trichonephila clavipes]